MPFGPGNGNGRRALTPAQKKIRESTRDEIYKAFHKFSKITKEDADFIIEALQENNPDKKVGLSLLEIGILKSITQFAAKGDWRKIEYVLNQIIGKPKETVDISADVETKAEFTRQREKLRNIFKKHNLVEGNNDNQEKEKKDN